MTEKSLNVGVAQLSPAGDAAENLGRIEKLTREAASAGVELLTFPELAVTGWGDDAEAGRRLAEPLDGPSVRRLEKLTTDEGVTLVAGLYEVSDTSNPQPYNTLVAVAPERGTIAVHRKVHLYDAWGYRESDEVQAGDGSLALFDVASTRVALLNCYEIRFPERAYNLVAAGAELLSVSAAWARGPLKEEHWRLNVRARAVENTIWVAAASLTGPEVVGRSVVVDPLGVIRAELDEHSDGWATVNSDRERVEQAQRSLPIRSQRSAYYHSTRG